MKEEREGACDGRAGLDSLGVAVLDEAVVICSNFFISLAVSFSMISFMVIIGHFNMEKLVVEVYKNSSPSF